METGLKILEDDGLTFAEKILSLRRSDQPGKVARAGGIVVVDVDLTLATDGTGPLAISVFNEMGAGKVWSPERIHLVLDHTYPAASEQIAGLHKMMREFALKQGCRLHEEGICHQLMVEEYDVPGMVIVGADSHTTTHGCLGAFSTGVGSTEVAAIWASGRIWLRVPEAIKVGVEGKMPDGVYAKDLALEVVGRLGADGANYKSIEYTGETVRGLTVDSRACVCNISMEAGAKSAVVEADEVTAAYLAKVNRKALFMVHAGEAAEYSSELRLEAEGLEPKVSAPHSVDNVKGIGEVAGRRIDQAFLGSCTNGRLEDLEVAARILGGRRVKDGVRLIVTPASRKVYMDALRSGVIETLVEAGGTVTNPTCAACVGTHLGILASDETCIASSNRNFIGRMGARDSYVFLASPATVAASAIEGVIADPRRYL